jgi:hypothetical protein
MADLKDDIAVYDAMRSDLETKHLGKWVLVHNKNLVAVFDTFDQAANEAVRKFGRGPYLIRQVGAAPVTLPASVLYHPVNA